MNHIKSLIFYCFWLIKTDISHISAEYYFLSQQFPLLSSASWFLLSHYSCCLPTSSSLQLLLVDFCVWWLVWHETICLYLLTDDILCKRWSDWLDQSSLRAELTLWVKFSQWAFLYSLVFPVQPAVTYLWDWYHTCLHGIKFDYWWRISMYEGDHWK